eukprot:gnl/TRDRNA2_/TRDRNA2_161468_c0_seq2.p1 gnl/TRDRNA2_/TRDRNA2_161468_c0~~gnl/TRDRNA2_/TRDRNA2_161468_c0_seq2.p1  ORF type:complete len:333 (+),score=54.25 gnl/TRDRNA2_/TRDRNA2_161468_c0_seq2:99-1097(+)
MSVAVLALLLFAQGSCTTDIRDAMRIQAMQRPPRADRCDRFDGDDGSDDLVFLQLQLGRPHHSDRQVHVPRLQHPVKNELLGFHQLETTKAESMQSSLSQLGPALSKLASGLDRFGDNLLAAFDPIFSLLDQVMLAIPKLVLHICSSPAVSKPLSDSFDHLLTTVDQSAFSPSTVDAVLGVRRRNLSSQLQDDDDLNKIQLDLQTALQKNAGPETLAKLRRAMIAMEEHEDQAFLPVEVDTYKMLFRFAQYQYYCLPNEFKTQYETLCNECRKEYGWFKGMQRLSLLGLKSFVEGADDVDRRPMIEHVGDQKYPRSRSPRDLPPAQVLDETS